MSNKPNDNDMTRLFQVFYTSQGVEKTRCEYATNGLCALNQAKKYFEAFGYGDEANFEVFKA